MTHSIEEMATWLEKKADRLSSLASACPPRSREQRERSADAETASAAAKALRDMSEALEPFAELYGEDDGDFPDDTKVTVQFGRSTHYGLRLADLRRAVRALAPAVAGAGER